MFSVLIEKRVFTMYSFLWKVLIKLCIHFYEKFYNNKTFIKTFHKNEYMIKKLEVKLELAMSSHIVSIMKLTWWQFCSNFNHDSEDGIWSKYKSHTAWILPNKKVIVNKGISIDDLRPFFNNIIKTSWFIHFLKM